MAGTVNISPEDVASAPARRRRSDQAWPYVRGASLSVACVWMFVSAYLALTPRTYVSRWVLNLPGAASNVSVSLESIGQSSSTPNSPFGSSSLSPKVVYKEIAEGERVRAAAAQAAGIELAQFGKPRVKLIDETALMMFEMTARSPEEAKRRSDALMAAFNTELDTLRNDELATRDAAVRGNLAGYQSQVRQARERMIAAQRDTGLVSTAQYAEMVSSLTALKRRLVELGGETGRLDDEQARLSSQLGTSPWMAGRALKLAADPGLQKAAADYNEAAQAFTLDDSRFGAQHPQRMTSLTRRDSTLARLRELIEQALPGEGHRVDPATVVALTGASPRADLYLTLVRNDAALKGKRRETGELTADKDKLEADVTRLSTAVARLEDLKKDQIVADAVLSSAMARLDSAKSDIYGSYPIVQVVAPPDIANAAAQPRPLYAALGGLSGTFFALLSWMLAWLQFVHRATRQRNA